MDLGALEPALDVVAELKLPEGKAGAPRVLNDEHLRVRVRLCAANALAAIGDRSGARLVTDTIRGFERNHRTDIYLAIEIAPDVLGEKAVPALERLVSAGWDDPLRLVGGALRRIGASEAPGLDRDAR